LLAGTFALLLSIAPVNSFGAAPPPRSVTASPDTDLLDGQSIQVDWRNFGPLTNESIFQCSKTPATAQDCSSGGTIGNARSNGTGSTFLQVKTGDFGGKFKCDFDNPCSVGVFQGPRDQPLDFSKAAFAAIKFGFPPDSCPQLSGAQIAGSGGSSANLAVLKWEAEVCRPPRSLNSQFTVKNSVEGVDDFAAQDNPTEFALTGLVPTDEQRAKITANGRKEVDAPVALSGVGFAYTIIDRETGELVTSLKLTPDLLAGIFTGQILNWNDQRILDLNPTVHFPPLVKGVGRADKSAATWELTSWFDSVAKQTYEAGGKAFRGPTTTYPSTRGISLVTGGQAVAKAIGPQADRSAGTIGWVDSSLAKFYGEPMVLVKNGAGEFKQPGDDKALALAVEAGEAKSGGVYQAPDYTTTKPGVYPLPMVSFVVTATNLQADKNDVMKKFLNYTISDGQKVLPAGYVPLPSTLAARSKNVVAQFPDPVSVSPSSPSQPATTTAQSQSSPAPAKGSPSNPPPSPPPPAARQSEPGGSLPTSRATQNGSKVAKKGAPAKNVSALASVPKGPIKSAPRPAAPLALVAKVSGAVNPLQSSAARYLLPILLLAAVGGLIIGPATAAGTLWTTPSKRLAIVAKAKAMFGR